MTTNNTHSSHSNPLPCAKYLQEDDITQECKDLISSLPKEQGWVFPHLYKYQGFWHNIRELQGVLTCQHHFQALETDILLATAPKCGTIWLKALMFAVLNRTHKPPASQHHPLITTNPHDLVPFLELKVYVDLQVPDLSKLPSPRLFATHLPAESLPASVKQTGCKVVYMCREPKDVFISVWHYANKLRPKENGELPLEEAFKKFCNGVSLHGPFWDHVLSYWKYSLENPQKVFFLKYEDLKEQPKLHLKRLAEFCGCPFSVDEENNNVIEQILKLCSFDNLRNMEVNKVGELSSGEGNKTFFRKGEVGDWVNYLTPEMVNKIDSISREKLEPFGLKF